MKLINRNFLIALLLLMAIFNFACPFKKKVNLKDLWGQTFSITNKGFTPKGANLWKQDGTVITEDVAAIDDGLTALFERARCHISEYDGKPVSRAMKHAEYIVAILKSTDLDSNGDPAIRIPAAQYAGTIYDKGGYVLIAGQMLAQGEPYGNVMAIPDHQTNFERMRDVVGFEAEHIVAALNLPTLYWANETHTQSSGHPFIHDICPVEEGKPRAESARKPTKTYAVGTYDTPNGKSLILLTK